jgi:vacuolar-type H+-ATPase subunit I/STV1
MSDVEALRTWIESIRATPDREEALAHLTSLAAELERLKTPAWDRLAAQEVRRLEAELERVKAERDEARASIKTIIKEDGVVVSRQRERLDKALTALREIEQYEDGSKGVEHCSDIARAAIAEIEGEYDDIPGAGQRGC